MDLTWSPGEDAFRAEARAWLTENLAAWRESCGGEPASGDTRAGFDQHLRWEQRLFAGRWAAVSWPEAYGGRDASLWEWLIFEEEYYRAGAPPRVTQNGIFLLAPSVFEFGTQAQQDALLPRMARTDDLWCQGWSEPDSGSDLASLSSRARRVDGGWVLDGQKTWTTRGAFCTHLFGLFRSDPARFWSFYRPRLASLGAVEPNRAHQTLAELERRGLLEAVITQNIDTLHAKAGSERVIEVHGSIRTASCQACGATFTLEKLEGLFDPEDGSAICSGCLGQVKPDVVLFGELLPAAAMAEAEALASRAELMLCVGSSLEVYPVAGLPSVTLGGGGGLGIVTRGPTPYDGDAEVRLDGDVVEELEAVLAAL